VKPGFYADITVFNPETVIDRATFEQPHQTSVGIEYVFVNGQMVLRKGQITNARARAGGFGVRDTTATEMDTRRLVLAWIVVAAWFEIATFRHSLVPGQARELAGRRRLHWAHRAVR